MSALGLCRKYGIHEHADTCRRFEHTGGAERVICQHVRDGVGYLFGGVESGQHGCFQRIHKPLILCFVLLYSHVVTCAKFHRRANSTRSDFAHRTASVSSLLQGSEYISDRRKSAITLQVRQPLRVRWVCCCSLSRMNAVRIASMLSRNLCLRLNAIFV